MLTLNKINFSSEKNYNSSYVIFKSTKEERIKKFQAAQIKRDYVNSKTDELEDLTGAALIGSFFLGAHNINFSKKLKTKEWLALGMFATACASLIALFIKKDQYAKEYDKEMNK